MYCADKRLSNKPVDVTMRLLESLLNKGHQLYIDNYYYCPELWNGMKGKITMLVGTCRKNRLGMPFDLFEAKITKMVEKLFFHLLTLVSIQTTILLNKHCRQHQRTLSYLAAIVKDLIVPLVPYDLDYNPQEDNVNLPLARLKERHFIKLCPETDGTAAQGEKAKSQCKVCAVRAKKAGQTREQRKNQRKQTSTWCPVCKVSLCIDCFEVYHTQANYI
ncbi:PiggyBac transposable element-derived protein 4 [Plakobranchus ocellatus]|uniref:PiggyBac transposable element-derived protein 4 n=1 Tax=Plakobranchus ocellatus TaxID=259542 RepID=A0AAV3YEN0_9GAST|nr:PiggyBac transposable element-derived protein 4 [Plakobranchus ocellatus]